MYPIGDRLIRKEWTVSEKGIGMYRREGNEVSDKRFLKNNLNGRKF